MNRKALFEQILAKKSYLCVGLDTDIAKIPVHLHHSPDPIFEFNRQIIDATADFCVAYKPNIAFYEAQGSKGWESLEKTLAYIPKHIFTIADAKRGDIGNTSALYAQAFFKNMNFDALTIAPYMGADSVTPFLNYADKWVILLALTSNEGSQDFEQQLLANGQKLYEKVLQKSQEWGNQDQLMYVVGATKADELTKIRQIVPHHFLLVPGVGSQGGDLEAVSKNGMNKECGLLVNSSRAIIYASKEKDFAQVARQEAQKVGNEMAIYLEKYL